MTGRYATSTDVTADRSKAQIEATLIAYGADQFMYGWADDASAVGPNGSAIVQFRAHGRLIRFVMPMPRRDDPEFTETSTGRGRSETAAFKAWEQAGRSRWRALLLAIKAKLEAVEVGLATFEQEFMAHTVLPDGRTVAEWLGPQLDEAYQSGSMPSTLADLPALGAGGRQLALGPGAT